MKMQMSKLRITADILNLTILCDQKRNKYQAQSNVLRNKLLPALLIIFGPDCYHALLCVDIELHK